MQLARTPSLPWVRAMPRVNVDTAALRLAYGSRGSCGERAEYAAVVTIAPLVSARCGSAACTLRVVANSTSRNAASHASSSESIGIMPAVPIVIAIPSNRPSSPTASPTAATASPGRLTSWAKPYAAAAPDSDRAAAASLARASSRPTTATDAPSAAST